MYINGEYMGDNPLGRLMHDFSTPNADEMYYKELADKMRFFKQDERGVEMVSKIVEEYGDIRAAEAMQQGVQQGMQQKAIEAAVVAVNAFKVSPQEAAEKMNAPLERVLEALKAN